MKKVLIVMLFLGMFALPAMAEDFGKGKDMGKGLTKLGAIAGNGMNATIGFDNGKTGELNLFAGYNYGYSGYPMVAGGANYLFTIADIDIADQIFPLSIGPQLAIGYWWDPLVYLGFNDYSGLYAEALAVIRWEYTFWFPLNVFVEFGAGLGTRFGETWNNTNTVHLGFAYSAGIGARYVFGQN